MALKTSYQDDVFTGNRKYTMVTNQDATISLVDVTEYSQEGDNFSANDINSQNRQINTNTNKLVETLWTLAAANWPSTTTTVNGRDVYVYQVNVTAIHDDHPSWDLGSANTIPSESEEEAFAGIVAMTVNSTNNTMKFYAVDKPAVDLVICVRGVE